MQWRSLWRRGISKQRLIEARTQGVAVIVFELFLRRALVVAVLKGLKLVVRSSLRRCVMLLH